MGWRRAGTFGHYGRLVLGRRASRCWPGGLPGVAGCFAFYSSRSIRAISASGFRARTSKFATGAPGLFDRTRRFNSRERARNRSTASVHALSGAARPRVPPGDPQLVPAPLQFFLQRPFRLNQRMRGSVVAQDPAKRRRQPILERVAAEIQRLSATREIVELALFGRYPYLVFGNSGPNVHASRSRSVAHPAVVEITTGGAVDPYFYIMVA